MYHSQSLGSIGRKAREVESLGSLLLTDIFLVDFYVGFHRAVDIIFERAQFLVGKSAIEMIVKLGACLIKSINAKVADLEWILA